MMRHAGPSVQVLILWAAARHLPLANEAGGYAGRASPSVELCCRRQAAGYVALDGRAPDVP
jgi:hypothetical protein